MDESSNISCFDLYSDLITDNIKEKEYSYNALEKKFDESQQLIRELQAQLGELTTKDALSQTENVNLKKNISALYNTAKVELARKDQEIVRLRKCIENRWRRQQRSHAPNLSLHTRTYREALSRSNLDNSQDTNDTRDSEIGQQSRSTAGLGFSRYALGRHRENRDHHVPPEIEPSAKNKLDGVESTKAVYRAAEGSNYEEHRTIRMSKHSNKVFDPPDKMEDFVAQVREELKDGRECHRDKTRRSVSASSPYISSRKKTNKPDRKTDKNFIDVSRGRLEGRLVKHKPKMVEPVSSNTRNRNGKNESSNRYSDPSYPQKDYGRTELSKKTDITSSSYTKKQAEKNEPSVKTTARKVSSVSLKSSNKVVESEVSKPTSAPTIGTKKRRRNSTEDGTTSKRSNKRSSPRTKSPPRPLQSVVNCVKKETLSCDLMKYLQKSAPPKEYHEKSDTEHELKVHEHEHEELCQKSEMESRKTVQDVILKQAGKIDHEIPPAAKNCEILSKRSSVGEDAISCFHTHVMEEGELEASNLTSNCQWVTIMEKSVADRTHCSEVNIPVKMSDKSEPDKISATSACDLVSSRDGLGIVTASDSSCSLMIDIGKSVSSCDESSRDTHNPAPVTSCDESSRDTHNPAPVTSRRRSSGCTVTSTTLWECNNGVTTWVQSPEVVNGVQKFRLKLSNSVTSLKSSESSIHGCLEKPDTAGNSKPSCSKESVVEKPSDGDKKERPLSITGCLEQPDNVSKIRPTSTKADVHEKSPKVKSDEKDKKPVTPKTVTSPKVKSGKKDKKPVAPKTVASKAVTSKTVASKSEKRPHRNSSSGKSKTPQTEKEIDRSKKQSTNHSKNGSSSKRVQSTKKEDSRGLSRDHRRPATCSHDRYKSPRRPAERESPSRGEECQVHRSVVNDSFNMDAGESLLSIPDDVYIFLGEESAPSNTEEEKPSDDAHSSVFTESGPCISRETAIVVGSILSDTVNLPELPIIHKPKKSDSDMSEAKADNSECSKLREDIQIARSGSPELEGEKNKPGINPETESTKLDLTAFSKEIEDSDRVKCTEAVSVGGCKYDLTASDRKNEEPCKVMQAVSIEDVECDLTVPSIEQTKAVPLLEEGESDPAGSSMVNEGSGKVNGASSIEKALDFEDGEFDLAASSMENENVCKQTKTLSVEEDDNDSTDSSMVDEDSHKVTMAVGNEAASSVEDGECEVTASSTENEDYCEGDKTASLECAEVMKPFVNLNEQHVQCDKGASMEPCKLGTTDESRNKGDRMNDCLVPCKEQEMTKEPVVESAEGITAATQNVTIANKGEPRGEHGENDFTQIDDAEDGEITSESGELTSDSEEEADVAASQSIPKERSPNELPLNDLRQKLQLKRELLGTLNKDERNDANTREPRSSAKPNSNKSKCGRHSSSDRENNEEGHEPGSRSSTRHLSEQDHNTSSRLGCRSDIRPLLTEREPKERRRSPVLGSSSHKVDRNCRDVRSPVHFRCDPDLDHISLRERDRNIGSRLSSRSNNRRPSAERIPKERHVSPVSGPSSHKGDRNSRDVYSPPHARSGLRSSRQSPLGRTGCDDVKCSCFTSSQSSPRARHPSLDEVQGRDPGRRCSSNHSSHRRHYDDPPLLHSRSSSRRGSRQSPPRTIECDEVKCSCISSSQCSPRGHRPPVDPVQRRERGISSSSNHSSHCRNCDEPSPSRERSSRSPHRSCHLRHCREVHSRGRSYSSNHSSHGHETPPGKTRGREQSRSRSPGEPARDRHKLERNCRTDIPRDRPASSDSARHPRSRERSNASPPRGRKSHSQNHGSDLIERKRKRPSPNRDSDKSDRTVKSGGHSDEKRKRQH